MTCEIVISAYDTTDPRLLQCPDLTLYQTKNEMGVKVAHHSRCPSGNGIYTTSAPPARATILKGKGLTPTLFVMRGTAARPRSEEE